MKDTELRGIVLQGLYERRSDRYFQPTGAAFSPSISDDELARIADQLHQSGLIEATFHEGIGGDFGVVMARISAYGVDVIEGSQRTDLGIQLVQHHHTYNISNSTNVAIGDGNQQTVKQGVDELLHVIDKSNADPQQKAEAKSLLLNALKHPLVVSLVPALVGLAA